MRKLILVRHSLPEIDPNVQSTEWHLSDTGRRLCASLADRLADYHLKSIVTSKEPKAVETAQTMAKVLGISLRVFEGLHEQVRNDHGVIPRRDFEARLIQFFRAPEYSIPGTESANQAFGRFARAVDAVVAAYPSGNIAIVTHGTVMALFVARAAGVEPFSFWRRLGLPSFAILSIPEFRLLDVVASVH